MPSVEEVKVHVTASLSEADRAAAGIRGAIGQLDEALALLRLVTIGSLHPSVAEALSRLEAAKARLEEAEQLTRSAVDVAEAYRSLI